MKKPWDKCNKPYNLALQYLWTAVEKAFEHGKPTRGFFRVYNFFKRLDELVLDLFHEYMEAEGKRPGLTMKALFYDSAMWNQRHRTTKITETHTEDYLALLKEW